MVSWQLNVDQLWEKNPESPTVGIIDSQSVKSTQKSEEKGYDAGKKIKGVKRHIVIDTNGFVLAMQVPQLIFKIEMQQYLFIYGQKNIRQYKDSLLMAAMGVNHKINVY